MRSCGLLFATGLLAACAHNPTVVPPAREVITEVKLERVEVPVRVPCVNVADIPTRPKPTLVDISKADTRQLAAAVAADLLALDAYADRATIVMMQCAKQLP